MNVRFGIFLEIRISPEKLSFKRKSFHKIDFLFTTTQKKMHDLDNCDNICSAIVVLPFS